MPDPLPAVGPLASSDGLTVIRHLDPVTTARALADQLGATVAIGGPAVQRAVSQRLRSRHLGIAVTEVRPDLDRLGASMRRAERVLERTRDRVTEGMARSLNTALAVHPDTIRRAAAEVTDAERAYRRTRAGDPVGPARGRLLATWLGIAGVLVGASLTITGQLLVGPPVAAVTALAARLVVALLRRLHGRHLPARADDVESARRRWHQLVGPHADPDDLETVLRRFDPQHDTVDDLASYHPAVRAARRAVEDRRRAWVAGWQTAVGDRPASAPTVEARPALVLGDVYGGLDDTSARRVHADLRRLRGDHGVVVVLEEVAEVDVRDEITIDLRPVIERVDPDAPDVAVWPA